MELQTQRKENKDLRVGLYCRVSTREQAIYGMSLGVQKSKGLGYLELFDYDLNNVKVYIDDGYSAKDLQRPKMKELLEDIRNNQLDLVVIYKLDRLSRKVIDVYDLIEMMIDHGCNLISVMDNIDIHTANGRMLLGILAIIAQWEREIIQERTLDGLQGVVEKGKFPISRVPFGYEKDDQGYLFINEKHAEIVRKIFDLSASGYTCKEIEDYFVDDPISELNYLSSKKVKIILSKKLYYGCFEFQGKEYWDIVPKIIEQSDYERANKMVTKRMKKSNPAKYYFGNRTRCACCGEILDKVSTKKKTKRYYYYYCPKCNQRINQDKLVEYALPIVYSSSNTLQTKEFKKGISNKILTYERKMSKIYDEYVKGHISSAVYGKTMGNLEYAKNALIAKLKIDTLTSSSEWLTYTDIERREFMTRYIKELIVDFEIETIVKITLWEN